MAQIERMRWRKVAVGYGPRACCKIALEETVRTRTHPNQVPCYRWHFSLVLVTCQCHALFQKDTSQQSMVNWEGHCANFLEPRGLIDWGHVEL